MTEQKKVDRAGAGTAETSHIAATPAPARRRRQTSARKQKVVLRVLRGEDIELMAADVSGWRDVFLATGASGLKHRSRDVRDEEIDRLRASVYRDLQPASTNATPRCRPGPQRPMSDAELTREIRPVITDSKFHGEGHRKIWARLRYKGIRTSKARVLRLMRENGLSVRPC